MRYLIPALDDLGEMFNGRRIAPIEFYETGRKSLLTSFGYQGISMIAVAGRDVAARNALARPLACRSVRCWGAASGLLCRRTTATASG